MDKHLIISFDEPWDNNPFSDTFQIKILKDLGEHTEKAVNEDGIEEETVVHKYKVEVIKNKKKNNYGKI